MTEQRSKHDDEEERGRRMGQLNCNLGRFFERVHRIITSLVSPLFMEFNVRFPAGKKNDA